jgi:two-component system, sensor histidine kinase and response regulator
VEVPILSLMISSIASNRSKEPTSLLKLHTDSILAAITEGVVIIDAGGVVSAVNDAGERILGAPRELMLGTVLLELPWRAYELDGQQMDRATHPIIAALRTGQPQPERLLRYPRPDGTSLWIATAARPLLGAKGSIEGALSSFRDVTAERAADELLRASEARYRELFETNATVQLLVDAETGVIRAANPAALRFYGFAREGLVGQHVSMLSRLDSSSVAPMAESIRAGEVSMFRRTQYRACGEPREVEIYASPLRGDGRTLLHAIVIDVSSRVEAEVGRRRLAAILDETPDIVGMFDLEGQLFYTNQTGRRMMGLPLLPDGADGMMTDIPRDTIHKSHVGDDAERVLGEATVIAAAVGTWRGETQFRRKNGEVRTMSQIVIAHRNTDGSLSHFSSILHDISEMRRAEVLLLDQAHELEVQTEELKQQTDELHLARDAAESASAAKSQFIAHMSHELRTPLTAIIGFSRVLVANRAGNLSKKETAYAERVSDNAIRLLGLIDQLLDLSKIEAGHSELELSDVDVSAMTTDVVRDLDGLPRGPGVSLRANVLTTPTIVHADATKLRQVLVNLVGNALKFTAAGSVTVSIAPPTDGAPAMLSVADTGVGVALESQASIFEPFTQEDTTITRRFGGTGLGLAISKRYCESMGFALSLDSVPGEGSTFTIHFNGD